MSKSQVIDEALSLFLTAVMEVRRGRRFVAIGPSAGDQTNLMTPTLAQLEWMFSKHPTGLSDEATKRMATLVESPSEANEAFLRPLGLTQVAFPATSAYRFSGSTRPRIGVSTTEPTPPPNSPLDSVPYYGVHT